MPATDTTAVHARRSPCAILALTGLALTSLAVASFALVGCDGGTPPGTAATQPNPPAASGAPSASGATASKDVAIPSPTVFPGSTVKFPPLGTFVQGTRSSAFAPGKVYVFEFFSTTCGHCAEAFELLDGLIADYGPKGFEFISVTSEDENVVREWLAKPENKEVVKHGVALDPRSRAQNALQSGTFQVQTPRLFAVRDGIVLWFGHPELAADPFAQIAAGTWKPSDHVAEAVLNSKLAWARNEMTALETKCAQDGNWTPLLAFLDSMTRQLASKASTFEIQKFGTLIGPAGMPAEGYALGRELAKKYANDLQTLRSLARTTMNSPEVKERDFTFALEMVTAADTVGQQKDARAAELMALYHFSMGDREKALEHQQRAIELEQEGKNKARFLTLLEKYKKEEPKPVPYAPRPAKAPAASASAGK